MVDASLQHATGALTHNSAPFHSAELRVSAPAR